MVKGKRVSPDSTGNLEERNGIWFSRDFTPVSYPKEGNKECFELEEESFWFKHRNKCINSLVKKFSPGVLFFDIGGGNGFVSQALQTEGMEVVLLEPGIEGATNAKGRGIRHVICSTLENAELQENTMEAAGLFDVIEHVSDDLGFMKSIHHYLSPEGVVYATVPAYNFLWSMEDAKAGHFRRYSSKSLQRLFMNAGFSVVYSTYIFSILPLPIFFARSLPFRLGSKLNSRISIDSKSAHKPNTGFFEALINRIWYLELRCVASGIRIPFGSSCLIVAKKLNW